MIIRWSRIIDAIAAYFIKRAETKPDDIRAAPECEIDRRIKFRTQIWDGKDHHTIN